MSQGRDRSRSRSPVPPPASSSTISHQDHDKIQELEATLKVLQKAVNGLSKTETVEDAEGYFVLDEK